MRKEVPMTDFIDRMPEGGISERLPWSNPLSTLSSVSYDGIRYACMEAAYQAQKTADAASRVLFKNLEGADSLKFGSQIFPVRRGWDAMRHSVMVDIALSMIAEPDLVKQAELEEALENADPSDRLAGIWREALESFKKGHMANPGAFSRPSAPKAEMQQIGRNTENTVHEEVKQAIPVGTCPWCGSTVVKRGKAYRCTNRSCGGVLPAENKYLNKTITEEEARTLFSGGSIFSGGISKTGKPYTTQVKLKNKRDFDGSCYGFDSQLVKD